MWQTHLYFVYDLWSHEIQVYKPWVTSVGRVKFLSINDHGALGSSATELNKWSREVPLSANLISRRSLFKESGLCQLVCNGDAVEVKRYNSLHATIFQCTNNRLEVIHCSKSWVNHFVRLNWCCFGEVLGVRRRKRRQYNEPCANILFNVINSINETWKWKKYMEIVLLNSLS